jgi:hypothetical protein
VIYREINNLPVAAIMKGLIYETSADGHRVCVDYSSLSENKWMLKHLSKYSEADRNTIVTKCIERMRFFALILENMPK